MSDVDPRLFNLLGGEELAPLRRRLRRCFERTAPGAPPDLLRLGGLGTTERESLALLTGQPPRAAKSIQIDVRLLDAKLRDAGIADSLRDALERIDGPIVDLASTRSATLASWSATVATSQHPALADYLQSPAALGLLKRLARQSPSAAVQLLDAADKVLHRLPAGGLARAQLAAEALGNAHALDDGQACATLVLAAWRRIEKIRRAPPDRLTRSTNSLRKFRTAHPAMPRMNALATSGRALACWSMSWRGQPCCSIFRLGPARVRQARRANPLTCRCAACCARRRGGPSLAAQCSYARTPICSPLRPIGSAWTAPRWSARTACRRRRSAPC
jgi:hypothetical protein